MAYGPLQQIMDAADHRSMAHGDEFTEMLLLRHGETDANVANIIQGRKMDLDLNETGRRDAAKVARYLSDSEEAKPAAIYSSDMKRADQTAQPIAKACGSQLIPDEKLTEMHMGSFEGYNKDEVQRSEAFEAFILAGRDRKIPGGGESFNQLSGRCVSRLNEIAKKHKGERVIVVSHEVVIREICRHADPTSSKGRKFPNASISVVHISGSDGRWILKKVGDVEHLAGE